MNECENSIKVVLCNALALRPKKYKEFIDLLNEPMLKPLSAEFALAATELKRLFKKHKSYVPEIYKELLDSDCSLYQDFGRSLQWQYEEYIIK